MLPIDQKIVMLQKIFTRVVVVKSLLRIIIGNHKIARELGHSWCHTGRGAIPHGGDVGYAPPTIQGAVVGGFSATAEGVKVG